MGQKAELFYKETNAYRVINNILKEDYKLGILRYSERYDEYYKAMMFEKGLIGELIAEFTYVLIMSKDSPLKDLKTITFVFERGSQFELLSRDPNTYMWVSPVPEVLLDRYGLVERKCVDNKRIYKDVLIHRGNYKLTPLDNMFIEELVKSKRKTKRI